MVDTQNVTERMIDDYLYAKRYKEELDDYEQGRGHRTITTIEGYKSPDDTRIRSLMPLYPTEHEQKFLYLAVKNKIVHGLPAWNVWFQIGKYKVRKSQSGGDVGFIAATTNLHIKEVKK